LEEKVAAPVWKTEITAEGIRRADNATPLYPQRLALTSPTSGGLSVSIVLSRTKTMELLLHGFNTVLRLGSLCYLGTLLLAYASVHFK
jgi:hypothetical protein